MIDLCKNFALSVRCWDFPCDVGGLDTSAGSKSVWLWSATDSAWIRTCCAGKQPLLTSWDFLHIPTASRASLVSASTREARVASASGVVFHLVVPCCTDRVHVWSFFSLKCRQSLELCRCFHSNLVTMCPPSATTSVHKKVIVRIFALMLFKVTPSLRGSLQDSLSPPHGVVLLTLVPQFFSSQCVRTVSVMPINETRVKPVLLSI